MVVLDIPNIDWSKTNGQLAKQYQCDWATVRNARLKLAPETEKTRETVRRNYHLLDGMNWKRPNKFIAKELGVSSGSVCKLRKKHAPETMAIHWERPPVELDWATVDWRLSTKALAERYGLNDQLFVHGRELYAPMTLPKWRREDAARWANIDWHRPSVVIAKSLKVSTQAVSQRRRIYSPESIDLYALRLKKNRKKKSSKSRAK